MRLLAAAVWAVGRCLERPHGNVGAFIREERGMEFLNACARICAISDIAFFIKRDRVQVQLLELRSTIWLMPIAIPVATRCQQCDIIVDELTDPVLQATLERHVNEVFAPIVGVDPSARMIHIMESSE